MKVILISGKARSGKDTSAKIMKKYFESQKKSVLVIHYADLVKHICKMYFGWNGKKDKAGRSLLQRVGTDIVREQKPNYWVNFVRDILKFFPNEWDYVLIPDCRFPNEIDMMKVSFDAVHVRLTREKGKDKLTTIQKNHPSEIALDGCKADAEIDNNGSKKELKNKIISFVKEI